MGKLDQILVGLNLMIPMPATAQSMPGNNHDLHVNHQLNDLHGKCVCEDGQCMSEACDRRKLDDLPDQHVNRQHLPLQYDSPLVPDSLGKHQLNDLHGQRSCEEIDLHLLDDFHDQRVNHQHLPLQYDSCLVRDSLGKNHYQLNDLNDQRVHLSHHPSSAAIDLHQLDDFPVQHVSHQHLPLQYDMIDTCSAEVQTVPVELNDAAPLRFDMIDTCSSEVQTVSVELRDTAVQTGDDLLQPMIEAIAAVQVRESLAALSARLDRIGG